MKIFLRIFMLTLVILPANLFAQYDPKVFDLKKAQDLYDERGFSQGAAISVDGKLAVNNQNGGVSYSYPISSFTSAGHPVNVALNYCGAVQFTTFKSYDLSDRHLGNEYAGWSKYHQNRPAWILGVNGWAVNLIGVTSHFHAQPGSHLFVPGHQDFDDRDMIWLADGYDFSNRMRDFGAVAQTEPYQDVIRLLRADGSVMELLNVHTKTEINNGNPDTCARLYTGTYFVNEANSHGYGIVEYATNFMPAPVHDYIADKVVAAYRHPVYPRILHFYPGDGTEVIFRERIAAYGMPAFTDNENRSGGIWAQPSIFYLEQIKSSAGIVVNFERARHYSELGVSLNGIPDLTRGRALTTAFTGHEIRFGYNSMIVEAMGRTTKIKFDTVMRSGTAPSTEVMPFANLGAMSPMAQDYAEFNEEDPRLFRSYLGQVTQIIDAENRVTKFDYESYTKSYRNFGFPHSNGTVTIKLKNYRLKSITEPTARYTLKYYGSPNELITRGLFGWEDPKKLNNMVDSVRKYDANGGLLTTDRYAFNNADNLGSASFTEQTTTDHVTGHSKRTEFRYANYALNNYVPILSPSRHTVLVSTIEQAGDVETITETTYATAEDAPAWGGSGNFTVLPTSQKTSVNRIVKSQQEFSYQVDTVRTVWETPDLAAKYGMEVLRKVTRTIKPGEPSTVLLTDTTTYLHLPMLDTTITWTKAGWDKLKTIANFFYLRDTLRHPDVVGKRWEQVMLRPPVAVFDVDTVTEDVKVAPLFGLTERSWTTDPAGAVTGKRNVYVADILEGNQRALRGKLVADSVLGSGGKRILKGAYTYGRQWSGDVLTSTKNALGVETRYSYGYSLCDDVPFWEECSSPPAVGTIIANDGTSRPYTLQWSPFAYWYGKPAAEYQFVRRYDPAGKITTDTLATYTERTYYGQAAATVEANGYLSKAEYDYNGRLNVAWQPYDFAGTGVLDTFTYQGAEHVDLYGNTYHNRKSDTIHCWKGWDGQNEYIISEVIPGPVLTTVNYDTLFASLPVTRVPDCPPIRNSTASKKKEDDNRQLQRFYESWLPYNQYAGYKGFYGVLNHVLDATSPLKSATRIDSMNFEVMITSIDPECVHLEVVIDSIFKRTFVHNCSGDGKDPDGTNGSKDGRDRQLQGGLTPVAGGYKLNVDLATVASQLRSRPIGSMMTIELRVKTPGATVAFINGTNAEDLRPSLNVYGEYKKVWDRADYTVAYDHNDADLTTTVRGKVDDARHTNNDLTSQGISARRSTIKNFFGADYRVLKTERTVIEPNALGVLVSRIDTARQVHTGLGARTTSVDTERDSIVTKYDALGRAIETVNSDGTHAAITYIHARPDSLGLSDQDFYGYVEGKLITNENGIKSAQFSDAFGRMRREIADYGPEGSHLNLTTKYEYDLLGRLVTVTNPKGQTTTYTHDEFGRVKTKTNPDLGTISYTYDDLGNVRFSQNAEQAAKGLLTYMQYDDLNRLTLTGEAYIDNESNCGAYNEDANSGGCGDGTRFTDKLNGNVLHLGIPTTPVTANPTMFRTPFTTSPIFTPVESFRLRNCQLDPEPRLDETTAPVPPFIMHTTRRYKPGNGGAGVYGVWLDEFENLQNYPEFARIAVQYDRMPQRSGAAWAAFPAPEKWDALAPKGKVRNLKGREVAVAYRDKASEPFHYSVMSYDERGRVEALIHYNENLGFDAVYYTYNSANQITSLTVADPLRRFTTWYGYNAQGNRDTVWTKLDAPGSGLLASGNFNNLRFPGYGTRQGIAPEIVYSYTKTDRVKTTRYPAINTQISFGYNHRKFLDSIVASRGGSTIFRQRLAYDPAGQVTVQEYQHGAGPVKRQEYEYDPLQRLTSWELDGVTTGYQYNEVGSRMQVTRSNGPAEPYGYWNGTNRLWYRDRQDVLGNDTTHGYGYNANGALTSQILTYNTPTESRILRREEFGYSFRGLMNRANVQDIIQGVTQPWQDWRYRYNGLGEREQKRLYESQGGVVPNPDSTAYPWVYYLLSGKVQLAVYHGQQLDSIQTDCGDAGLNRVYLYPHEYLTYGANDVAMLITRPTGAKEYKIVDHLGSTRAVLNGSGSVIGAYDNEPYGAPIAVAGVKSRNGFIGKETDKETSSGNFGVRQYDPEIGAFLSTDAAWENFRGWSTYQYSRNSPINRLDPNGLWDITVYVDDDRSKNSGLGTAVLTDRNGNVQYVWQIRAQGSSRDRFEKNKGDTPTGVYKINEKHPWIIGGNRESYGPNHRLNLDGQSGEIVETNRTVIRMHAGRQEDPDRKTGEWKPNGKSLEELPGTQGCIRAYEDDMIRLKELTDQIQKDDPLDKPGVLIVTGQGLNGYYPADATVQPVVND